MGKALRPSCTRIRRDNTRRGRRWTRALSLSHNTAFPQGLVPRLPVDFELSNPVRTGWRKSGFGENRESHFRSRLEPHPQGLTLVFWLKAVWLDGSLLPTLTQCHPAFLILPSLHSRATLDSRLSICICRRLRVRSLSLDLRLYAISTATMKMMSSPPATAMLTMAGKLRGLSGEM